jgi:Zn-dependent protease
LTYLFLQGIDQPSAAIVGKAVGLSLLIFATVVIHEFGHAAVAMAMGLAPISIRIHAMGGATSYRQTRPSPGADAAIAAAGPAATVILWGVAAVGAAATTGSAHDLFGYWRYVCVLLTIFNLLPGIPLDGGALVKSAVWALNHDERKATRFAAAIGMALAVGLVGFGFYWSRGPDNRTGLVISLIIAITIGLSAYRTWQYTAPGGPKVRPDVMNARNEDSGSKD